MTRAICSARWLLPLDAHLSLVRAALERAPRCTLFVRRAHLAPTPANPFGWELRAEWLRQALRPTDAARVDLQPLREHWDEPRNLQAMQQALGPAETVCWISAGPLLDSEDLPAGWSHARVAPDDPDDPIVGWLHRLYEADAPGAVLDTLAGQLPPACRDALREWTGSAAFDTVRADWRQIASERKAWSVAPYPVVLSTVDAVVQAGGRVLLIRRGRPPGRGLWALPGGFLEPAEETLHAALRELVEETGLPVSMRQMRQALRGSRVFDHPERSQRGRVISHAFFFDLGEEPPPPVQAGDDAAQAAWVPLAHLPALQAQLHDDHFHIIECFLGALESAQPPAVPRR
ncbi:NUDIX domain-containing protein [Ramlibacter tataouinensis]|uniref:NUDIX domain-containing protein n=1 Tax=Ramlibacter tataouinensis TaxID=94132 RepID=UPI0022F37F71|nr:NUDIX domain-containing protein [Ramlibacter tataouinensis]WBY02641.1 NUDIX domain-containing protein [Ramlibacter tataouinensis]